MTCSGFLGIDMGSISTNLVVVDGCNEVLYDFYARAEGNPIASVQSALARVADELPRDLQIVGVGVTGSGRSLVGSVVGADIVKNEITAHARAAIHLHPDVQTIVEIGGQDSKLTIVRDGAVVDFAMNLVCAAGTGSFLDSQAKRLNISIDELSAKAVLSLTPTTIAGRCTVFAESDMIHKQQLGHNQADILMGLCHALVRNFLSNVCRGKELRPPVLLQGGISANLGIRRAFREALGCEIVIPRYHMVMGAYGAALLAAEAAAPETRFRGFEIADHEVVTEAFSCGDCPNCCEIIDIVDNGRLVGRGGGRCGKWEGATYGTVADHAEVSPDSKPSQNKMSSGGVPSA